MITVTKQQLQSRGGNLQIFPYRKEPCYLSSLLKEPNLNGFIGSLVCRENITFLKGQHFRKGGNDRERFLANSILQGLCPKQGE